MRPLFLFIWILLLSNQLFAQIQMDDVPSSNKIEFKRLKTNSLETQEMFEAINNANKLMESSPNEALDEIEKALTISYRTENKRGEAHSYQTLGAIHFSLGNYSQAVSYYQKALNDFEDLSDSKGLYLVYKHYGQALESNKNNKESIKIYKKFLSLAISRSNVEDEILAKESLGRALFNSGSYSEAKNYYQQLLTYYKTTNLSDKITDTYEHIGKCYAGVKDTTQALRYFNLAGIIADNQTTEKKQIESWQNVGRSYNSVGKYDKSVEYEKKALKLNKKRGDKSEVMYSNAAIANDYLFMNKADEAIPFLKENINLAEELGEVKSGGEAYRALSDAYVQLGKIDDAKSSFEKYREYQEKLMSERENEISQRESDMSGLTTKENQIALLVKDKELDEEKIKLLEQERILRAATMRDQRQLMYVLTGVLILVVIGLMLLYRSVKQKKLANKLLSIRSLRSQMNPHFIFNSLNSVNSFISKSDERSANKYLTEFARLMRTVLEHSKQDFVTLADEVSVLQRYLSLEHIRFSQHFDFTLEVDEDLQQEKLLIPPMLVQPYIENAIWHGLRYLESKGYLSIRFIAEDEGIRIEIQDNGIGRTRSAELKTKNQKAGKSTGISNTESRLDLLNDVHQLSLRATIEDLKDDGSGTKVQLFLPYIDVDDKRYAEV